MSSLKVNLPNNNEINIINTNLERYQSNIRKEIKNLSLNPSKNYNITQDINNTSSYNIKDKKIIIMNPKKLKDSPSKFKMISNLDDTCINPSQIEKNTSSNNFNSFKNNTNNNNNNANNNNNSYFNSYRDNKEDDFNININNPKSKISQLKNINKNLIIKNNNKNEMSLKIKEKEMTNELNSKNSSGELANNISNKPLRNSQKVKKVYKLKLASVPENLKFSKEKVPKETKLKSSRNVHYKIDADLQKAEKTRNKRIRGENSDSDSDFEIKKNSEYRKPGVWLSNTKSVSNLLSENKKEMFTIDIEDDGKEEYNNTNFVPYNNNNSNLSNNFNSIISSDKIKLNPLRIKNNMKSHQNVVSFKENRENNIFNNMEKEDLSMNALKSTTHDSTNKIVFLNSELNKNIKTNKDHIALLNNNVSNNKHSKKCSENTESKLNPILPIIDEKSKSHNQAKNSSLLNNNLAHGQQQLRKDNKTNSSKMNINSSNTNTLNVNETKNNLLGKELVRSSRKIKTQKSSSKLNLIVDSNNKENTPIKTKLDSKTNVLVNLNNNHINSLVNSNSTAKSKISLSKYSTSNINHISLNYKSSLNSKPDKTAGLSFKNKPQIINKKDIIISKLSNNKTLFSISQAGLGHDAKIKTNQDNYIVVSNIINNTPISLLGVFDGHGEDGHLISAEIRNFLDSFINNKDNYNEYLNRNYSVYELFIANDFHFIRNMIFLLISKLKTDNYTISKFSGSTFLLTFIIDKDIICCNIGDSRAVSFSLKGNHSMNVMEEQLNVEHKPENPNESQRILSLNAEVKRSVDELGPYGPYRVFEKDCEYPGLAMSRSMGDFHYERIISNEADFFVYKVKKETKFVVLGSDGLWDFWDNKDIAKYFSDFLLVNSGLSTNKAFNKTNFHKTSNNNSSNDIVNIIYKIMNETIAKWSKEGNSRDDITMLTLYFG